MDLLAISPPGHFPGEPEWIGRLLDGGLCRYHLRKPGWTQPELRRFVEQLPESIRTRVVLHRHHPLVETLGLGGWHFPDAPGASRRLRQCRAAGVPSLRLSRSLHRLRALSMRMEHCAYAFLSPVFPSISKPGHAPPWTDRALREALRELHAAQSARVYALGGIQAENAARCRAWGFDGLVLHGCLWEQADPLAAFLRVREAAA